MSMNLDRIVRADITRATRTTSRRSFGSVLIAAYHTAWLDRVRSYTDPDEMLDDGFVATDAAYLAAVSLVSQSPRVPSFKIGRRAGAPTQLMHLVPRDVAEGWAYSVTIGGETATYTAQAGDDVADVATGLAAAINALTVAVTASGVSGTHVAVTADAAGAWFGYADPDARLDLLDETVEPATTLATDLAAIKAADADWYGLIVADAHSAAQIAAIAAWVETQTVVYVAHSADHDIEDNVTTDIASVLAAAEYLRTKLFYSRVNHGSFPDAALLGKVFPQTVGSADFEYKALAGITADDLSDTVIERLVGSPESPLGSKRALVYVEALPTGANVGTPITYGGLTSGGEWLDVVIGIDFVRALIQERAFNVRISAQKVPYTEAGIDALEGAVRSALNTASAPEYAILDPETLMVESTKLEDVDEADRQARHYDGIRFDARVQGAIRAVRIRGTVRA